MSLAFKNTHYVCVYFGILDFLRYLRFIGRKFLPGPASTIGPSGNRRRTRSRGRLLSRRLIREINFMGAGIYFEPLFTIESNSTAWPEGTRAMEAARTNKVT